MWSQQLQQQKESPMLISLTNHFTFFFASNILFKLPLSQSWKYALYGVYKSVTESNKYINIIKGNMLTFTYLTFLPFNPNISFYVYSQLFTVEQTMLVKFATRNGWKCEQQKLWLCERKRNNTTQANDSIQLAEKEREKTLAFLNVVSWQNS